MSQPHQCISKEKRIMTTEKKGFDWKAMAAQFGQNFLKGLGLGAGFAVAGVAAGAVSGAIMRRRQGAQEGNDNAAGNRGRRAA